LANDPPLILADEPTGNLDSSNGRHVLDLLQQVRRSRGVTLVMVTHDPNVAAIADDRLVLRDGRPVVSELERGESPGTSPLERVEP
jgi:putative ABC transport system ATP-binding protein